MICHVVIVISAPYPICGSFFTLPTLTKKQAAELLATELGITPSRVKIDLGNSTSVTMKWLDKVIKVKLDNGDDKAAAKAYMLHFMDNIV